MRVFIVGIREHNVLGYIPGAYLIEYDDSEAFHVIQNILPQDVEARPDFYTKEQAKIVKLVDEISEKNLYRKFAKKNKQSLTEFFNKLDKEALDTFVLPYFNTRFAKILELAHKIDAKIFLKSSRYDTVYRDDMLEYVEKPITSKFKFVKKDNKLHYSLKIFRDNAEIDLINENIEFLIDSPCHFILDNKIYHANDVDCKKIKPFRQKKEIVIASKLDVYFKGFVRKIILQYDVEAEGFEIRDIEPEKKVKILVQPGMSKKYVLVLQFYYDNFVFSIKDKNQRYVHYYNEDGKDIFLRFERDFKWENKIYKAIKKSGLKEIAEGTFQLDSDSTATAHLQETINWINENSELLTDLGVEVEQRLDKKYFTRKINLDIDLENKIDWFDLKMTVRFGQFEIPFMDLKEYILEGKREFELPNGEIAVIPEYWFSKYKNILLFAKNEKKESKVRLSKAHFTILQEVDHTAKKKEFETLFDIFMNRKWKMPEMPSNVSVKLRNYQKQGFAWLYELYKYGFGGCLADDMGLGKTVQMIVAFSKALEDERKKTDKKLISLFVVPKSLIHNWHNEFAKFAPHIKVLIYTGVNRDKLKPLVDEHDVVLTSYGIARNDIEFFAEKEFFFAVLDESQYIKNPSSKIYQAIVQLKVKNRFVLTGTPIENSLSDLWTQINFVNPGLLGSYNFFRSKFINPIEKNNDPLVKAELKRMISPFVLRRVKGEVIKDLPDKAEQTVYCEMSEDQALVYETEKAKVRNEILSYKKKGKLKEKSIFVLRAMTRLRQIANHPKIVDDSKDYTSGKFEVVLQKIETLLEENHKVLIFSSFVKHLEIYQRHFDDLGWKYALLIGETENREEIIDYFQNNESVQIFLISLKAGGVGLNLTAADYVLILDPWWNPAAEEQAISRAHRIGQKNNVFVYRFITVGSIEEKILHLQQKKKFLASDLIDSSNIFAQLDEESIVELFD